MDKVDLELGENDALLVNKSEVKIFFKENIDFLLKSFNIAILL